MLLIVCHGKTSDESFFLTVDVVVDGTMNLSSSDEDKSSFSDSRLLIGIQAVFEACNGLLDDCVWVLLVQLYKSSHRLLDCLREDYGELDIVMVTPNPFNPEYGRRLMAYVHPQFCYSFEEERELRLRIPSPKAPIYNIGPYTECIHALRITILVDYYNDIAHGQLDIDLHVLTGQCWR
jgi:hypothetical protein